ncbi:MAG: heavy-metal-associated domain-containing protein [Candidatus Cyclobacteriaceae bacterium M3_2C_046]
MKTKVWSLIVMFALGTFAVFAGEKTEKIEVNGNCGMCEKLIKKAALSVKGVSNAEWDQETKNLEVTYDDQKTSTQQIQTSVAMVGHDTQMFSASAKKYANLPECCQYARDENRNRMSHEKAMNDCGHASQYQAGCNHDGSVSSGSCCGK